jgi:hypothetical protein
MNDNLTTNASNEAESPAFLVGAVSGSVSFPKGRPKCCGREMYAAGGTVGIMDENSVRYWRCDVCKQEVTDLAS